MLRPGLATFLHTQVEHDVTVFELLGHRPVRYNDRCVEIDPVTLDAILGTQVSKNRRDGLAFIIRDIRGNMLDIPLGDQTDQILGVNIGTDNDRHGRFGGLAREDG